MLLADGTTKPIKNIHIGDEVLTTNPDNSQTEPHTVTRLHDNNDTDLTDVVIRDTSRHDQTLHTTQHHPFWDQTHRTWTDAANLTPGTTLRGPDGNPVQIVAVRNFTGHGHMRDLTIDTTHTYYVVAGDTPVLVHNCGDARL